MIDSIFVLFSYVCTMCCFHYCYVCDILCSNMYIVSCCFFFQAEDGIRDLVRSRGLGDVYKRQDKC